MFGRRLLAFVLSAAILLSFLNCYETDNLLHSRRRLYRQNANGNATFTNPLQNDNGGYADPWVIFVGGNYYTCLSHGDYEIVIKKSPTLQDLFNSPSKVIFRPPPNTPYSLEIWAPELHYLQGRWYVYFTADDGNNDHHRMYVLEGGEDPFNPLSDNYMLKSRLRPKTDKWGIDASPFIVNNQLYLVWSGWEGDVNVMQKLYVAKMENPFTISGERYEISSPELPWETIGTPLVNEGPEALWHNGSLFIIYSASGSWTEDYCLGQLRLTGSDPLTKSAWTKKPVAVFSKSDKVFGPGHASFTRSPDGKEDWIVFHAERFRGSKWDRKIHTKKFGWNLDGSPNFGKPADPGVDIPVPSGSPVYQRR